MCHEHHQHNQLPCLQCQPQDYIRMVQHLIEWCLLFRMSRDDCIKALEKHANIDPNITLTVWKELLKENKGFFQAYFRAIYPTHFKNKAAEKGFNLRRRKYWQLVRRLLPPLEKRVS